MTEFFDEKTKKSIREVVLAYKAKRDSALGELGLKEEEYKKRMSQKRGKVFDDFENNLKKAKVALEENGFVLHEAGDGRKAGEILIEILKEGDVIAKTKTNTGREIGIEDVLKDFDFFETDLGDAIVGLFDEQDQHYVLPAIHISAAQISEKIKQVYGETVEARAEKLTRFLCGKIREKILKANVGLTGANFFTKTGQIVLLENEGNISLVSRLPKKHVVLVGIDKLVESVEDATELCRTAAIFGTGQKITQYISVISGPSKTADIENTIVAGAQGAMEIHMILVDNGRRQLLQQGFGDLLRCINCGACINFCPVYNQIGNKYGGKKYIGSKGVIFSAFSESLEKAKEKGSYQCTICISCQQNCPMRISLPKMMREIRKLQMKKGLQTKANVQMMEKVKQFGNPFGKKRKDGETKDLYCC